MLLCLFNLYKLVCTRTIPNNSRMLLQSKFMKIDFWRGKKRTQRWYLLSSHHNEIILGSLSTTNNSVSLRKKNLKSYHRQVSKHAAFCSYSMSKTVTIRAFWTLDEKKDISTLIYVFLTERIKVKFFFSPLTIVTRGKICLFRLDCLSFENKVSKKETIL